MSAAALSAAVAAESAFGTREQEQAMIATICGTQLTIGVEPCACLAERAMTELSDGQREYLIMTVVQPPAAERMPMAAAQGDLRAIAGFLDAAGKDCAGSAAATAPQIGGTPESESPAQ
jgi:hypothetical protein